MVWIFLCSAIFQQTKLRGNADSGLKSGEETKVKTAEQKLIENSGYCLKSGDKTKGKTPEPNLRGNADSGLKRDE